ncbi:MAG TPA: alpha-1,4-glucan--maltose-1-phosphate maltosyltransferase [Vicinamibacterales bacterium]|nr:alpha-1,4-glucan--maltose-1-phosphate maltosyltransferase [Vicinamibacterales bacterium]
MSESVAPQVASARPPSQLDAQLLRRVVIEGVEPQVDDGRFPVKRTVGEEVIVQADVLADGHDAVAAVVLFRKVGDQQWREAPMRPLDNDRWQGAFRVDTLGRYEYTVEAWVDRFASWRQDLSKKAGAGQDVSLELVEGAALVAVAVDRAADAKSGEPVLETLDILQNGDDLAARMAAALSDDLATFMAARPDRNHAARYDRILPVVVDRERARFGAWYEMFPRSAGTDPSRSATFAEAAEMLPYVAAMGFDVLYLPPIHPIGRSFRKGPNNTLAAGANDPGSPWAIGSEEGGHTAVEPGLGTIEDFDTFVAAAAAQGLEIALDVAFQTSPDHPYVREHPDWFRQRPDGSIKYAENPPKKYQDIYPLNFESDDWRGLWHELKGIFEFWIQHGVRIFRVDNPHTKPFRFWEWALAELTRQYPDTIFLSEAFTRPKVMKYLAKIGFSQSYTYFTWRNTKEEIVEYFTELTGTSVREYLRPNLFANTPDILHAYLQRGGRPAFQIRLVLAATLGAAYGIYSGFELAENVPVRHGSEEYLDSEKYQIRVRDYKRADSLAEFISQINAIRRAHPALQHDWGLSFHRTDNGELLAYSKRSVDGRDLILVVLNLDPVNMQHGFVQLPIVAWGLTPHATVEVVDLLSTERYFWRGEWNYIRLDPQDRVAHILHVQLPAPLPSSSSYV